MTKALLLGTSFHYEKQLALRLVQVADVLRSESPQLAESSNFVDIWALFECSGPGSLSRVVRYPFVDWWVAGAERLIANRIHIRYPDAHPARHLKQFGHLAVACAEHLDPDAAGMLVIDGRAVVPVAFGRAILTSSTPLDGVRLTWKLLSGTLTLSVGGDCVAEVDLSGTLCGRVAKDWAYIEHPNVDGRPVDLWTYEPLRPTKGRATAMQRAITQAFRSLPKDAQEVVLSSALAFAPRDCHAEWIAGVIRVCTPLHPRVLLETACHNLLRRFATLGDAENARDTSCNDILSLQLRAGRIADEFLTTDHRRLKLDLSNSSDAGVRDGDQRQMLNWRELDEIGATPTQDVMAPLSSLYARDENERPEAEWYRLACVAYAAGRFDDCIPALLRCISMHPTVDEYWYLLAFTLRHTGQRRAFEAIVFDGLRNVQSIGLENCQN